MGITTAILRVRAHRKSEKFADVDFLFDSGAVYSLVPGKILDKLDIEPYREMSFALADGTSIKRKISSAYFEYEGKGRPAPVVYGEEGDSAWSCLKSFFRNIASNAVIDGRIKSR